MAVSHAGLTVALDDTISEDWGNMVRDAVVIPFASAAARDAAITSPAEGMTCYLADVDAFTVYTSSWQTVLRTSPPLAIATRAASQSIPNTTSTVLSLDTQVYDSATMFAPTDSKIYAPVAGVYLAVANIVMTTSGWAILEIAHNGTALVPQAAQADASGVVRLSTSLHLEMAAGQYVEATIYQSSGAARNTTGRLSLAYVREP